ncbi:hypothetical protein GHK92_10975 [Nocardioides sp. dk4132]|nr:MULTISPECIES: hypothetical protein [unclassified Nocardioides]MQW76400.1 hypothetical protein [Nocardioides sp. dk4132]
MTFVILLLVLAAVLLGGTLRLLARDSRGPAAPPSSHVQDPQFRAPGAR